MQKDLLEKRQSNTGQSLLGLSMQSNSLSCRNSIPWLTPPKQTPWQPWLRESPRPARAGAASRTHHHTLLGFPITDTATGSDEMWESIKN